MSGVETRENVVGTARVGERVSESKNSVLNGVSGRVVSTSNSGGSVLVELGEGGEVEDRATEIQKDDRSKSDLRRERTVQEGAGVTNDKVPEREVGRYPDPLYEDPDKIQATLRDTPKQKTPKTLAAALEDTTGGFSRLQDGGGRVNQSLDGSGGLGASGRVSTASQSGGGVGGVSASECGGGEESTGKRLELGEDPLYAVPEQLAAKLRAKRATVSSSQLPNTHSTTAGTSSHTVPFMNHSHSDKIVVLLLQLVSDSKCVHLSEIPGSVEPMLREALEVWRKAESKRESDVTLARMNYSRAASESADMMW